MNDVPLRTAYQQEVHECFMIHRNASGMLFLDAPGGTGKIFLLAEL